MITFESWKLTPPEGNGTLWKVELYGEIVGYAINRKTPYRTSYPHWELTMMPTSMTPSHRCEVENRFSTIFKVGGRYSRHLSRKNQRVFCRITRVTPQPCILVDIYSIDSSGQIYDEEGNCCNFKIGFEYHITEIIT